MPSSSFTGNLQGRKRKDWRMNLQAQIDEKTHQAFKNWARLNYGN